MHFFKRFRHKRILIGGVSVLAALTITLRYREWQTDRALQSIEASGGTVTEHYTYPPWVPMQMLPMECCQLVAHRWFDAQFANVPISDREILPLSNVSSLEVLELHTTSVTGAGLSSIRHHTTLRRLFLNNNPIEDESIHNLAGLHDLEWLELNSTNITDKALPYLTGLTKLDRLGLVDTRITDIGLQHLLQLKRLRHLELYGTDVGDGAIGVLSQMTHLKELHLHKTRFTDLGLREIKRKLPGCVVLP